jgi:signal transduction histidine kinase
MLSMFTIFSAFCSMTLAILLYQRKGERAATALAGYLSAITFYSMGFAFEVMSPSLEQVVFWTRVQYIGIPFLPLLLMRFAFQFYRVEFTHMKLLFRYLFLLSLLIMFAQYTSSYHRLFHYNIGFNVIGNVSVQSFGKGLMYYALELYHIVSQAIVMFLSVRHLRDKNPHYRNRAFIILISCLIPSIIHLLYQFSLTPLGLDLVPSSFAFSAIILGVAFMTSTLLGPSPIASWIVLDSLGDACIILDQKDRLIGFNPTAQTWFPLLTQESVGCSAQEIFSRIPEMANLADTTFNGSGDWSIIPATADQKLDRYLSVHIRPIHHENVSGVSLLITDVTEDYLMTAALQETNDRLVEINRLKDMVINIMSHDVRSPLLAMRQLDSLLASGRFEKDPEKLAGMREELDSLIDRADLLMRNLVSLSSQPEIGSEHQDYPISISSLFDAVHAEAFRIARRKRINLQMELEEDVLVLGSEDLLTVVLRNLLDNALKYTQSGKTVVMSVDIQPQVVELSVQDTGIGMPDWVKLELDRLRWGVSLPGTNGEKGSGIGLYTSMMFLRKMNTDLVIESEPSFGTRVSFSLQRFQRKPTVSGNPEKRERI